MNKKRKIFSGIFTAIGCLLTVTFIITAVIDSLNYSEIYSAPLYVYIMVDALSILLPAVVCFGIAILFKKYKAK